MPTLQYLFAVRGAPEHGRSDNGPQFIAKQLQRWLDEAVDRRPEVKQLPRGVLPGLVESRTASLTPVRLAPIVPVVGLALGVKMVVDLGDIVGESP